MTNQQNSGQYGQYGPPNNGFSEQEMVVIRERKKKRKKRKSSGHKRRRVPLAVKIILGVLIALGVCAGGAYAFLTYNIHKGDEELHAPDVDESGKTITYKGKQYRYNDDVVAILVMGKDDESNYGTDRSCTDANMLVALDTETKALDVIAIPRDSMVEVDLYKDNEYVRTGLYQFAVAYGVDVDTEDAAARNSMKSATRLFFDMPIERYFVLEMDAIGELASAVGGVSVEALGTYPGAEFEVGDTVLLEGDAALSYVRYRDINVDKSAQDRQQRQMQFIKAFIEKLRTWDAGTILNLYNMVQKHTFTNLEFSDISYLASVFANGKSATTKFMSLQGTTKLEPDDDGVDREHIYLDEDSVMEATLDAFYTEMK